VSILEVSASPWSPLHTPCGLGGSGRLLDLGPKLDHFWPMTYLLTSDLKQRTGRILDAAIRQPQFVIRGGALFVIAKVEADAALLAAADQATGLQISRPGLTEAERTHRNAILRSLDDAEGW